MKPLSVFSDEAVNKRSMQAARELDVAARAAKVKRDLDNANMDKKERRPLKEFTEFRAEISEHVGVPAHSMPPNILILRRKTIRQFPNNVMVALYFNDKLGQYFSIPYGSAGPDDAVITPVALKEEEGNNTKWFGDNASSKFNMKPQKHQFGDEVRYRLGTEGHLRVGKVQGVMPEHLLVKRNGSLYKVPHHKVVHNSRTGYTREGLNEISIPVATRAHNKRQNQGAAAVKKGDYTAALPLLKKAFATHRLRSKKYEREDKGETVKEEVIQEDAISHLQKVKAFKTSEPLRHKDGSQTKVDPTTAHALLTVYHGLHADNRKKYIDSLEHSQPKFHKVLDFAWKQVV